MSKSLISDTSKNNNTNEISIKKKITISNIEDIDKEIDLMTNITGNINLDKDEKELNDKNYIRI